MIKKDNKQLTISCDFCTNKLTVPTRNAGDILHGLGWSAVKRQEDKEPKHKCIHCLKPAENQALKAISKITNRRGAEKKENREAN